MRDSAGNWRDAHNEDFIVRGSNRPNHIKVVDWRKMTPRQTAVEIMRERTRAQARALPQSDPVTEDGQHPHDEGNASSSAGRVSACTASHSRTAKAGKLPKKSANKYTNCTQNVAAERIQALERRRQVRVMNMSLNN